MDSIEKLASLIDQIENVNHNAWMVTKDMGCDVAEKLDVEPRTSLSLVKIIKKNLDCELEAQFNGGPTTSVCPIKIFQKEVGQELRNITSPSQDNQLKERHNPYFISSEFEPENQVMESHDLVSNTA